MNSSLASIELPQPVRAQVSDDPADILQFALDAYEDDDVALATLVEICGGAARSLGAHVAIAADGRFCGYVSGGCVEAAVATEALMAIAEGRDRTVMFGAGSRFFDIVLPCGGGITVSIHILRDVAPLLQVLARLKLRQSAALHYSPSGQSIESVEPKKRSAWIGEDFVTVYRPPSRLIVSAAPLEGRIIMSLAEVCRYDVVAADRDQDCYSAIDRFTAVVLLHHDLDGEMPVLAAALASPAFYVGALGSSRTHQRRSEMLEARGFAKEQIALIKAPIGLFGPARDATSLALSVLSDVAATRLAIWG